ncbi:MAG: polysaccharide pyruvyl transferase family protein [Erysipelotrichaceae bacterium]|nr:polysaccharide pyruvyl transferase family protein [Erysipelotrichaceae bacterium]
MSVFLYNHGGSANHGCEALVRTVKDVFNDEKQVRLLSEAPQQDIHYGLNKLLDIQPAIHSVPKLSWSFLRAYFHLKRTGDYFPMDVLPYKKSIKELNPKDIEISIGGDVYCYEDYPKYIQLHKLIYERGCKSVLLGCSLEKKLFSDPVFVEDMKSYDYISARESITYGYLKDAGLTNIGYAPDTAFTLQAEYLPLPAGFIENNTVGINLSPLASGKEKIPGIALANYRVLIQSIMDQTDCAVALIPHVVWEGNDDRKILKQLYDEFKETGRIIMIPDMTCTQLKGYISRCRFFVGARTHATIAAYSSCVPTLVLGYSIKSRGIAKDLFGDDEHYVIPVQKLDKETDLKDAFWWLWEHEDQIKNHLELTMPAYITKLKNIKPTIEQKTGRKL